MLYVKTDETFSGGINQDGIDHYNTLIDELFKWGNNLSNMYFICTSYKFHSEFEKSSAFTFHFCDLWLLYHKVARSLSHLQFHQVTNKSFHVSFCAKWRKLKLHVIRWTLFPTSYDQRMLLEKVHLSFVMKMFVHILQI